MSHPSDLELRKPDHFHHAVWKRKNFVIKHINPFMPSSLFYHNSLERLISYIRDVWLVFLSSYIGEISELNANGVDPDQTPFMGR